MWTTFHEQDRPSSGGPDRIGVHQRGLRHRSDEEGWIPGPDVKLIDHSQQTG